MSAFTDKIPAELRLDIYERILRFGLPLRRVKPVDELDGTEEDELRQYVRGDRVNISILFTCRKAYDEGLPVFYKLNTASLCHEEVCLLNFDNPFTRCDRSLLENVVVVDWLEVQPWTRCRHHCAAKVAELLRGFNRSVYPKLQSVKLSLEGFRGGFPALGEQLLKAGYDLDFQFTGVGRFEVAHRGNGPIIEMQYNSMIQAWTYFHQLPDAHPTLEPRGRVPAWMEVVDYDLAHRARHICLSSRAIDTTLAAHKPTLATLMGNILQFNFKWLEADRRETAKAYEKITEHLWHHLSPVSRGEQRPYR